MVDYALKVLDKDRLYFYSDNAELYKKVIELYQDFIKRIEDLTYQSIYNEYIKYDYEPFAVSGFRVTCDIVTVKNQAEFLYYLIDNYLNNINILEDSYKLKVYTDELHPTVTIK